MFVRALLSFHTAPLPGHNQNLLSSIIPTLARLSRKSNHSRTYRPPREGVWSYQSNRLTAHQGTTRNVFILYLIYFLYFLYLPFPRTNFPAPRINIHQQDVLYSPHEVNPK